MQSGSFVHWPLKFYPNLENILSFFGNSSNIPIQLLLALLSPIFYFVSLQKVVGQTKSKRMEMKSDLRTFCSAASWHWINMWKVLDLIFWDTSSHWLWNCLLMQCLSSWLKEKNWTFCNLTFRLSSFWVSWMLEDELVKTDALTLRI